jgi:hypothetical protein
MGTAATVLSYTMRLLIKGLTMNMNDKALVCGKDSRRLCYVETAVGAPCEGRRGAARACGRCPSVPCAAPQSPLLETAGPPARAPPQPPCNVWPRDIVRAQAVPNEHHAACA